MYFKYRKILLNEGLPWFEVPLYEDGVQIQEAWIKEILSQIDLCFIKTSKNIGNDGLLYWYLEYVPNRRELTAYLVSHTLFAKGLNLTSRCLKLPLC